MASKKKSKKKDSQPEVPSAQAVPTLTAPSAAPEQKYEPMSLNDFQNWMNTAYDVQLKRAPEVIASQKQAQEELYRSMGALQREQGPITAGVANKLMQQYNPEFRQMYNYQGAALGALGKSVSNELAAGYDLGPGLSKEIEQSIRGAQTARGNILGNAPTAQEAFGKGQASIDLYNQRVSNYGNFLGQQQNYLQGRNPMDMMGQTAGTFMGSTYYPSQSYVDTGLGASAMASVGSEQSAYNSTGMQGYSTFQSALQNYNQNLITGTSVTNEGIYNQYDRAAEAWQYQEAVRRGLYSTPSTSSSGGMGGIGTTAMAGIGTGLTTGIGLAAAGASTGMAAAGGVAAAASAAGAAICWLARKVIPERWEEFQHYLFTRAPEKLRRLYIYNARRLAREVSDTEAAEIGELMTLCLR